MRPRAVLLPKHPSARRRSHLPGAWARALARVLLAFALVGAELAAFAHLVEHAGGTPVDIHDTRPAPNADRDDDDEPAFAACPHCIALSALDHLLVPAPPAAVTAAAKRAAAPSAAPSPPGTPPPPARSRDPPAPPRA